MSEDIETSKHEFGPGIIHEIATKLYKSPIAAFREAVSNAFDAMVPYPQDENMVEIYTNVLPDSDIIIEDYGTGIENYKTFKTISPGKKVVGNEVSSYEKINGKIIGEKGMGKLSFLNLSSENMVEFYSNNGSVGMHVIMTMDGFAIRHIDSNMALPHRGLKVVIKRAKKPAVQESRLIEYLSRRFALRIDREARIFVNGIQVHIPDGFDTNQFELFKLDNGSRVFGNLKIVEKPRLNNIEVFVKKVYVDSKDFEYKVEGWLNCDNLEPETSRDGIYEGSETYMEFMKKLMQHLEKNFERKFESKDKDLKSGKQIAKIFMNILNSIHDLYPEMTRPRMSGNLRDEKGIGILHPNLRGGEADPCTEQKGMIDASKTVEPSIAKPIGNGKGHKNGTAESKARIIEGDGKVLSPSSTLLSGKDTIPQLKVVVIGIEEKPVVFFSAPNRLVINSIRPSSNILLNASPKDPTAMKSRVLPLLVRAGIDAFPGSWEMPKQEWFEKYDALLDSTWSSE